MNSNNNNNSYNKESYDRLKKLDALSRHKIFINDYFNQKNKLNNTSNNNNNNNNNNNKEDIYKNFKTDYQILKENHQFLRDSDGDVDNNDDDEITTTTTTPTTWEEKLAKSYYDRLYKEYAIIDLSRYKSGEIGLRWRIESEVVSGRGQFTCANKKCDSPPTSSSLSLSLKSFEVPFSYNEFNQEKVALVKVVLCSLCSKLLNYSIIKKKKKELKSYLKEKEKEKEKVQSPHSIKRKRTTNNNNNNNNNDDVDEDDDDDNKEEDEEIKNNKRNKKENHNNNKNNNEDYRENDIFNDMFI